jgi:chemotaxis signal transduction protein
VANALSDTTERVLVVRSGGQRWALKLSDVVQVGAAGRLIRLPHAPRIYCGATSFRGRVVPVIDLARLHGIEDSDAGVTAFVLLAGQTIGLRVTEIEGLRAAAQDDSEILDLDAIELPAAASRHRSSDANGGRKTEAVAPPNERGLAITISGQAFWLPLTHVVELLDEPHQVDVPWSDPLVPAVLMRGNDVLPLVRLDCLLGLTAAPEGPVVVVQAGPNRFGFRIDRVPGIFGRGVTPVLQLADLIASLPGNSGEIQRDRVENAQAQEEDAWLAIVLEQQLCLLPLGVVQSVALASRHVALPSGAPASLRGVRAIGGRILPVTDQREALGLSAIEPTVVDIVVTIPGTPQFVLTAQQIDSIVRLRRDMVHATGGATMIGGVVRLGHRLAWLLTPSALAPSSKGAP